MATLESDISALIAHNWFASENLANPGDKSGANPGDSYLATITTALENSLSTPNSQKTLWVGGMGSGVRNKTNDKTTNPYSQYPADPSHQDGFYWVTGPEGLVTTTVTNADGTTTTIKGTKFWDTSKSYWNKDLKKSNYGEQVYGYTKWSSWSGGGQPDNSAPFLTVGYGNNNAWDDAAIDGGTTVGFVQETNLYNSSLNIKTDGGKVTLQGDLGKSVGLDTVKIDAGSGSVTTGNTKNTATKYNNGTIYADHGVYINGGEVTVGGEIHSGGTNVEATRNADASFKDYLDNVTIQSSGNLTVHGIEVNASTDPSGNTTSRTDGKGGKIKLTSTGTEGVITLGDGVDYNGENTNGGVLKAASTANDAVVIDAQGEKSKFVNETTSTKAIDTQGRWKIYSASPEQNTFGKNLNSETDAQWTSDSTKFAANSSKENKFIFQTTPTITLYVEDKVKTYGDDVTDQLPGYMMSREELTGVDGTLHNVNEFTDAFQEKPYTNYISVPEGQSITVTSVGKDRADGAVGTATRTGGTHAATEKSGADGKNAVYDLNVNLNGAVAKDGYVLKSENATLEILKRKASITGTGTQTYGGEKGKFDWTETKKENIASGSNVSYTTTIKSDSDYTKNQGSRKTADHGTYNDSVSFDGLKITDSKGNDVSIADNYDLTTTGTIDVAKAKLTVNPEDIHRIYGQATEVQKDAKTAYNLSGFANGDTKDTVDKEGKTIDQLVKVTNDVSKALKDNGTHTQNASAGGYDMETTASGDLTNYNIVIGDSKKVYLDKAELVIDTDSNSKVYGNWQGVKTDIEGAAHIRNAETAVVNGDKVSDLEKEMGLTTSSEALIKNADGTYKTNHVKDGGYAIDTKFADAIANYTVKRGVAGTETLTKAQATVDTDNVTTTYGMANKNYASHFNTAVNGDDANELLKQLKLSYSTDAYDKDGKPTNDVKEGGYDLLVTANGSLAHDDYDVTVKNANVTLNKAKLVIDTDSNSKVYGDWQGVKTDVEGAAHIRDAETAVVNGDKVSDLVQEMGLTTSSEALQQNTDGTYKTNHVKDGGYAIVTTFADTIKNYDVSQGTVGTETLTKAKATVDTDAVTTTYGTVDKNYTSQFKGEVNGDDPAKLLEDLKLTYKTEAYKDDTHTNDVKDGGYTLEVAKTADLGDYNVTVNNSNVILNPKTITIRNTMTQQYGSTEKIFSEATVPADQLANGDKISTKDLKFDIKADGDYAKSLAENKKKNSGAVTADAGTYTGDLIHTGGGIIHKDGTDAYKNYKVTVEGDIIVTPKDIYTDVIGKGSTLNDLIWTIKINPKDQMVNGDSVEFTYTPGNLISYDNQTFDVNSFIDEKPISDGTQIGNYIYHPKGIVQLTFNPIVKPDVWAHSGGYRPRNKIETSLPVFRVEDTKVGQYGTYGVEHNEEGDRLVLSATGMRLPEPDQVPDEERTFTTTLSTETGSGTFKLVYNGVSLKVYPQDKEAEETVRAGDKTKNVSLSEKALYVGYTEMGLDLIDLKGVYIYFN